MSTDEDLSKPSGSQGADTRHCVCMQTAVFIAYFAVLLGLKYVCLCCLTFSLQPSGDIISHPHIWQNVFSIISTSDKSY